MENLSKLLVASAAIVATALRALFAFVVGRRPMIGVWIKRGDKPWERRFYPAVSDAGGIGIDFGPGGLQLEPGDMLQSDMRLSDAALASLTKRASA